MDTVVATHTFEGDLMSFVKFCRSLQSRENWPGAVLEFGKKDELFFGVGMRLKAAAMIDIKVHETLGEIERLGKGVVSFDSTSWSTWPDGHSGAASEYLFTPAGGDRPATLRVTYNYTAPSKSLVKPKQLPAFHDAMERVIARYTERLIKAHFGAAATPTAVASAPVAEREMALAAAPAAGAAATAEPKPAASPAAAAPASGTSAPPAVADKSDPSESTKTEAGAHMTPDQVDLGHAAEGMDSVTVARAFDGDLARLVDFTRTLNSRTSWPGSQLQYERGDHLIYGVGMRLRGAAMTDITVDESLGEIQHLDDGEVRFRTTQRVTWPDGHGDAVTEYRFIPGDEDSPSTVEYTYAYAPPSKNLVKPKEQPAFRQAMHAVANRYLKNLTNAAPRG